MRADNYGKAGSARRTANYGKAGPLGGRQITAKPTILNCRGQACLAHEGRSERRPYLGTTGASPVDLYSRGRLYYQRWGGFVRAVELRFAH